MEEQSPLKPKWALLPLRIFDSGNFPLTFFVCLLARNSVNSFLPGEGPFLWMARENLFLVWMVCLEISLRQWPHVFEGLSHRSFRARHWKTMAVFVVPAVLIGAAGMSQRGWEGMLQGVLAGLIVGLFPWTLLCYAESQTKKNQRSSWLKGLAFIIVVGVAFLGLAISLDLLLGKGQTLHNFFG